jgi:hypothetical protein
MLVTTPESPICLDEARVICPHTDRLFPQVKMALTDNCGGTFEMVDVSGSDTAYYELLCQLWADGKSFCLVEHDIVVTLGTIESMDGCGHEWCVSKYPYLRGTYWGLGCTRFRAPLLKRFPDLMDEVGEYDAPGHGKGHWCPTSDTRVFLADDLRWIPIGDVGKGDVVLGVDEFPSHSENRKFRRFVPSIVEAVAPAVAEVARIILNDGTEIRTTWDHQFLVRSPWSCKARRIFWATVRSLQPGQDLQRYLIPTEPDVSRESGYLAGLFDGEGTIYPGAQRASFGQKPGEVLDRGRAMIERLGFATSLRDNGHGVKVVAVAGGLSETLRFLSMVRPERLITKVDPNHFGMSVVRQRPKVMAVEPAGRAEVIQMQTSSGTYLSEGIASHNCTLDMAVTAALRARRLEWPHLHGEVQHLGGSQPAHGCR